MSSMDHTADHTARPDSEATDSAWRRHLLTSTADIQALLTRARRIAVLGIKPDPTKPAYYVPAYAQRAGYEIVPVPVYYPEVTDLLGELVYRRVSDIPGDIDIVDVFRKAEDIPPHLDDIIAKRPGAVWFQLGIRNDMAAEVLARAGIDVVQDHCVLVELHRMGR